MPKIRRYTRKPSTIEVVEFDPDAAGLDGHDQMVPYHGAIVKQDGVYGSTLGPSFHVWNATQKDWVRLEPGHFIRVDKAPDDCYPITPEYLEENFDL